MMIKKKDMHRYDKQGQAELHKTADGFIRLKGRLDNVSVSSVYDKSLRLFKDEPELKIDLSGVTHSNTAGAALLVEWLKEARDRDQNIHFVNTSEPMLKIVRMTNLERVLPIS